MSDINIPKVLVGGDIFSLITVGMYNNPLAIYREYIQNAADAVATSDRVQSGKVEIKLDPAKLRIRIRDNGPGLSFDAALRTLLPIARSEKKWGTDRGFRGIGRLAGLAFAQSVTFITRTQDDQRVSRIVWDGPNIRQSIAENPQPERAIQEGVTVETLSGAEWPAHFFEVEVSGIGRYAAGLLLNREAVRAYIGEVGPVPIAPQFPFASEVESLFGKDEAPLVLEVVLDGEVLPVTRRFDKMIRFSNSREDHFADFEKIDIPDVSGSGRAAIGWVAHSSYRGVIPKGAGIRGVRVRAGNIQVGDETIFDHLFPEDRFNRWCVGELHIVDSRIIPNGRRDYFEPGPHIRNLENHVGVVARRIIKRCREVSATRNKERKFQSALHEVEEMYDLAASGYLSPKGAKTLAGKALDRIQNIEEDADILNGYTEEYLEKFDVLKRTLVSFRAKRARLPFGSVPASEVRTYRKVFQALAEVSPSPRTAKELMEAVLARA